jgi:hypothetical protein
MRFSIKCPLPPSAYRLHESESEDLAPQVDNKTRLFWGLHPEKVAPSGQQKSGIEKFQETNAVEPGSAVGVRSDLWRMG